MHLHFERTVNAKSDCRILSLTWMGKVPDELAEEEAWKLNRTNYYQEGWLATGNVRGIVGITFTTSHCKKNVEFPSRTNYNLRGHRSEIILVKWNEPYQKLASCDSSGVIFVWIKYEGRWSIELINDRSTPVTHFAWSHDGRMALICYQDGFVLVGSVAGQRYWSSMLSVDSTITCGIWTPDDQQVYFGTNAGQIVVMDVHGAMVSEVQLGADISITSMAWSCEKFKMEENEFTYSRSGTNKSRRFYSKGDKRAFLLAVSLQNGYVYLLSTFDDVTPIHIKTGLQGPLCMEWNNSRELLAVAGITEESPTLGPLMEYTNMLQLYSYKGVLLHQVRIPYTQARVSTLTWGHNDKRLFLATGCQIHIAWVAQRIPSLQLLSRIRLFNLIPSEAMLSRLPLPLRIRNIIGNLYTQTIRCCVPEPSALREFVSRPPTGSVRLHCTMIKHDEDINNSTGICYTLYLEYLGGLVPLLKGKRTSKICPEFVIFDPQVDGAADSSPSKSKSSSSTSPSTANASGGISDSSDSEKEELWPASPLLQRTNWRRNRFCNWRQMTISHYYRNYIQFEQPPLSYVDTLPEQARLVEVTSNLWATKFKIHGLASGVVPSNLGKVTYKTSLLHLQPRQMTLVITELRDDFPIVPDPTFNPNLFSEDEEDPAADLPEEKTKCSRMNMESCPPIAPMSPRTVALNRQKSHLSSEACSSNSMENHGEDKRLVVDGDDRALIRPQNLSRPNNSQNSTSFIGPLSKPGGQNQKHAISPICCEVSVPALQSPKNAVAPSDTIFDRPSAPTIISYSTTSAATLQVKPSFELANSRKDFSFNIGDQKSTAGRKQAAEASSSQPVHSASKREDGSSKVMATEDKTRIMPRSCSVGYLDMVDAQMVPPRLAGLSQGDNICNNGTFPGRKKVDDEGNTCEPNGVPIHTQALLNLEKLISRLREDDSSAKSTPASSPKLPRSSPSSPTPSKKGARPQSASPIRRRILNSPFLRRRYKHLESSDDDTTGSSEEIFNGTNYKDLETFQKSQLRQKLKRGKIEPNGGSCCNSQTVPQRREFVMHNKAPMWNENSQVYQLDFGGRVTQESAKNFQIEFRGKQVMQFGRVDGNAYTLDFQYPFSALQAFAVALANVTQRLK
uniref:SOCS box domain-containing protein n=2 Tax=Dendroctonus ponderosae TaxID=77166 RepID=A0AAR5Q8D1_DENPD